MNDKGYTLVELLIAIALLGGVALCVAGIFVLAHFIGKWW